MAKRKRDRPVVDLSLTIRSGGEVKVVTNATLSFASQRCQRKLVKQMREAADNLERYLELKTSERKSRAAPLGRRRSPPRRRPSAAMVN